MATRAEKVMALARQKGYGVIPKEIPVVEEKQDEEVIKLERFKKRLLEAGIIGLLDQLVELFPGSKYIFCSDGENGRYARFLFDGQRQDYWSTTFKAVDITIVDNVNASDFAEERSYNETGPYNHIGRFKCANIVAKTKGIFFPKVVEGVYVNKTVVGVDGELEELVADAIANAFDFEESTGWDAEARALYM